MRARSLPGRLAAALVLVAAGASGAARAAMAERPEVAAARARLEARLGVAVTVGLHHATGLARFVRLGADQAGDLAPLPAGDPEARARAFLAASGDLFGVRDPGRELDLAGRTRDRFGFLHLTFVQLHRGLPVFAGLLRAHFDGSGRLRAVQGTFVPDLDVDATPRLTAEQAREVAETFATTVLGPPGSRPLAGAPRLVVYVPGLERDRPGAPLVAWEVEVADGGSVRARVFVDAQRGKVADWLPEIYDALFRRAYSGVDQAPFDGIPDSWPNSPDWVEGDPYPTGTVELDATLAETADAYRVFAALGRDSWDGQGHRMDISWNHATFCPNASWNGRLASFCAGFAAHDVVVHEWTHAFTERTAGLLYRWQSGALNESLSDAWGESLDQATKLEGLRDNDGPSGRRADGACSAYQPARLRVTTPETVAGDLPVGMAEFGPPPNADPIRRLVEVEDGGGADPHDACEPLIHRDRIAGRLAFADRGACDYQTQARHAQEAGAVGLVIANLATSPDPERAPALTCDPVFACDMGITIPVVSLARGPGDRLRAVLSDYIGAAIQRGDNEGAEDSVRWLLGEDVRPYGVARDMWAPPCLGAPGKVSDPEYHCATSDNGGVHVNSGVPNHAFALLVDGGSYNGRTITGIGRVRAAHILWRAQSVYLEPSSDFADFADALEASCDDLRGASLPDPWGGAPVTLTAADCQSVTAAAAAVELRTDAACGFQPILEPNAPPLCGGDEGYPFGWYSFETGAEGWTASRRDVASPPTFEPRDWTREHDLPDRRSGVAFHAPDPLAGDCVTGQGGDDESGVLVLESPDLVIPVGLPARLAFVHYLASERDWDGGNLKLSVAGGPWTLVPASAFLFNPYNGVLFGPEINTDPLAGEPAFHGTDEGSNAGSWGRSEVDLTGLVAPGQRFRLRFEFGSDICYGTDLGWWVDDVKLAVCAGPGALFLDGFETGTAARWSSVQP
jgi:hypothetical protein